MTKGFALDKFCRDKLLAINLAQLVDRQDIWMVKRRNGLGLLMKAPQAILVLSEIGGQKLESDLAIERCGG